MRPPRRIEGQASVEYAALIALVAVVLVGAQAITSGGLSAAVVRGIQRGLCALGGPCPKLSPLASELEPCPLERSRRADTFSGSVAILHLGASGVVVKETLSDGTARVSFVDGSEIGAELGLGAHLRVSGMRAGAGVHAGVESTFNAGRAWKFPNRAAADAFVARYGGRESTPGRILREARSLCFFCDALGLHDDAPPPADETFEASGHATPVGADLSYGPLRLGIGRADAKLLGVRETAAGERTYYYRLSRSTSASVGGVFAAASAGAGGEQLLAATFGSGGRPLSLHLTTAAQHDRAFDLKGSVADLTGRLRDLSLGAGERAGLILEAEGVLDLTKPANLRAVERLARAGPGGVAKLGRGVPGDGIVERLDSLIARRGVLHMRDYSVTTDGGELSAGFGAGVKIGAGRSIEQRDVHLLRSVTHLPGLRPLPRADCAPA